MGVLHHLSDSLKHDSNETPIKALNLDFNSGGVSNGKITLMDDPQYESGTNTYGIQSSSYHNKLTNIIKNTHDADYVDYVRRLPSNYASMNLNPSGDDWEHSVKFTLDDIVVNASVGELTKAYIIIHAKLFNETVLTRHYNFGPARILNICLVELKFA